MHTNNNNYYNNYKNDFKILNSTVPEMFRYSSKVQFAETISCLSPIPKESIDILVQSCLSLLPISHRYQDIEINDNDIKKVIDLNPSLYSTMVSIRSQESVIALSHLFKCSNGVLPEKIIAILTSFLNYLTYTPQGIVQSQNDIQNTQNFTHFLLNQLAILTQISQIAREQILPKFLKFFTHITKEMMKRSEFLPLIFGALQALGDKENFHYQSREESLSVLSNIESLLMNCSSIQTTFSMNTVLHNIMIQQQQQLLQQVPPYVASASSVLAGDGVEGLSAGGVSSASSANLITSTAKIDPKKILLLLLFQALEQMTFISQELLETDFYRRVYNDILPMGDSSHNELSIKYILVITRCGVMDPSIGKIVLDYLEQCLSITMNLTETEAIASMQKPFSENLYQTIFEAFVEMTDKYQDKAQRVLDLLKDFLCISLIVVKNVNTKNCLFQSICQILKNQYDKKDRGIEICKSSVSSFTNIFAIQYQNYLSEREMATGNGGSTPTNTAQQTPKNIRSPSISVSKSNSSPSLLNQYQYRNETLSNIIIILGKIACSLNDLSILDMIQPLFMSNVTYPPGNVENLIIEQLTEVALLEHIAITKDIVTLFTNFFKKICNDPNQALITNIFPIAMQKLAKYLTKEELRQDLCRRVLKLFQQLGKFVKNSSDITSSPSLKGMGFLLSTLSELILLGTGNTSSGASTGGLQNSASLDMSNLLNSSGNFAQSQSNASNAFENISLSKLYRTVWFYCVFFKFSVQGTWRSDWYNCVQVLANHLSPLISGKAYLYMEMEVDLEQIIKQGFEKDYFNQVKALLFEQLPGQTAYIKSLTLPQLAYVYSVFTLETMRFQVSGSFVTAFSYLSDRGIENINVINCIQGIVDKVFNDFLQRYSSPQYCQFISEADLSTYANFLLMNFCYPYEPVRKAADNCISSFVTKFPQVLWSRSCLSTLLDLIQVIGIGARAKPMELISIPMPNYPGVVVELPDDTPSRQRLRNEVIELGKVWLKNGCAQAPSELQELLHEYLHKFTLLEGQNHIGLSLAVEIGSNDIVQLNGEQSLPTLQSATSTGPLSVFNSNAIALPNCCTNNAGHFIGSLQIKSIYAGEVKGMINTIIRDKMLLSFEDVNAGEEKSPLDIAYLRLLEEFEKIIQIHKKFGKLDNQMFTSIMYRSSAFMINHYSGQSVKLIHLICYAPAFIFTAESMNVGIACWKWLLSEKPELTIFIMTSIHDIWNWCVNQRIGLYTNNERDASPLAIDANEEGASAEADEGSVIDDNESVTSETSHSTATTNIPPFKPQSLDKQSHVPHKIWIAFIEERFLVAKNNSDEQIDIITSMLQKALSNPEYLSVSAKSLGTRFKLLLLCLRLIKGDYIRDLSCARLLRERVYTAALGWFYLPPAWYGPNEAGSLEEYISDTKLLIEFCKTLQEDTIFYHLDKRYNTIRPTSEYRHSTTVNGSTVGTLNSMSSSTSSTLSTPSTFKTGSGSKIMENSTGNINNPTSPIINNLVNGPNRNSGSPITSSSSVSSMNLYDTATTSPQPQTKLLDQMIGSGIGTMSSANTAQIIQTLSMQERPITTVQSESQLSELRKRRNLIILLVGNELERMSAWNSPIYKISVSVPGQLSYSYESLPKQIKSTFKDYLISAWKINPRLAINFNTRFPTTKVRRLLTQMVVLNTRSVISIPEALPLLVTEENVKANIPELKYLLYWETVTPPMAISLLGKQFQSHPLVSQYACRVLKSFPPETIMFYIPQLVQALRYDKSGQVENYLVEASLTSDLLSNQIIWNLQTYTEPDPTTQKLIDDPGIHGVAKRLKDRILSVMTHERKESHEREFKFFENFTYISGQLLQNKDPSKRKGQLKAFLNQLEVNRADQLYLPTNPQSIVVGLEVDSATTLQSHARVPILVNFIVRERALPRHEKNVELVKSPPPTGSPPLGMIQSLSSNSIVIPENNSVIGKPISQKMPTNPSVISLSSRSIQQIKQPNTKNSQVKNSLNGTSKLQTSAVTETTREESNEYVQGCIFKSNDDIRQDMLALQIIDVFKRIFKSAGLDLYLFPYKVFATKPGCGMIELVPNTMSRDQIGKKSNGNLYDYFISKYGNKNSIGFQNARINFIKSMAAYSVVSYILQIKDRHNANILVDEEGHIVHIDFGFIFDISPGGDLLTFEASPFKLNQEMIDIMGGNANAEQFIWFMESSVKAFLAARQHMDSIITLVELMLDTHLPCFKEQTIQNLRQRFCPNKSETTAAKFMSKIVVNAFSTMSTFATYFYDVFQYYDNGIEM